MRTDSLYLTKLAKEYEPDVEYVSYEDIEDLGLAYKHPDTGKYYISISSKLPCALRQLHAFYHELAHIVLFHLGYKRFKGNQQDKELAADIWASEKMGITNEYGIVQKGYEVCKRCMDTRSDSCLKEESASEQDKAGIFAASYEGWRKG